MLTCYAFAILQFCKENSLLDSFNTIQARGTAKQRSAQHTPGGCGRGRGRWGGAAEALHC